MFSFRKLPFHKSLFIVVSTLFTIFLCSVFLFQYNRERDFRREMLDIVLQDYNRDIYNCLSKQPSIDRSSIDSLVASFPDSAVRITVFDYEGNVLAESSPVDLSLENHGGREEFVQALKKGEGAAIRKSSSLHQLFFYSARKFDRYIVRSSLPFIVSENKWLQVDRQFVYFLVVAALLFFVILLYYCTKLGKSISLLQDFSNKAEQGLPINTYMKPVANSIGNITGNLIAIYQKLLKTKSELSNEKEKIFKHLQFSKEGLAVFSSQKEVITANNLFIQYINLIADKQLPTVEEVLGIVEFKRITRFIDENLPRLKNREEYRTHVFFLTKNSKTFQIECIIFQDRTFEISVNDVTQQEEESRLKRQLTQNIAHELKTPVSSIQGYMETIINNPSISPAQRETFMNRCYAQTIRLSGLLHDISILNRIDESDSLFDKESIDLHRVITEIVNDSHIHLQMKQMQVSLNIPEQLTLEGNNSLLYSIFRNLMDNAIAYAGEKTEISISCYMQDKDYYYFSFADNGVGVNAEHLNRLFERFYRVDKGRSRKLGGTGLGLAIVKNAVYFHKGEISAKNRADGGLEFLFSLRKQ